MAEPTRMKLKYKVGVNFTSVEDVYDTDGEDIRTEYEIAIIDDVKEALANSFRYVGDIEVTLVPEGYLPE